MDSFDDSAINGYEEIFHLLLEYDVDVMKKDCVGHHFMLCCCACILYRICCFMCLHVLLFFWVYMHVILLINGGCRIS